MFVETRAHVSKDHLRTMRHAGVVMVQLGVESFSSAVLKLIDKGTTAIQNIRMVKWCAELGVQAFFLRYWDEGGLHLRLRMWPAAGFAGLREPQARGIDELASHFVHLMNNRLGLLHLEEAYFAVLLAQATRAAAA